MLILGISCFYHDAAAALLKDGILISCAEEERFSRIKHDNKFPLNSINFVLQKAGVKSSDLDCVVFYEKPFIKMERILMTILQMFPLSYNLFKEAMPLWLSDKLWIKNIIMDKLNIESDKIFFVEHHLSHAASAFFCSPYKESAIITADAVGEWTTTTIGVGKGNKISLLKEIKFPHSIGLLYSTITSFLGFEVNEGEYKVMGLSAYGVPRYVDKIYKLINIFNDGSFSLNMDYFCYHYSTKKMFSTKFEELFGNPRKEEEEISEYYADIAASIQLVTEEILLKMVNYLHKETNLKKLCMAGGVALNSVVNGRIFRETPFKEIYIQPAAGDSGGAVGAALYFYNSILNKPRTFIMEHTYWGENYTDKEIKEFLDIKNIEYQYIDDEEKLFNIIINFLIQQKVIGWFQGRFEWGPRALGNRSIIADPRNKNMKDIVNQKIKFREPFRPFAPSVLEEKTEDFFKINNSKENYPGRFMLYVVDVIDSQKDKIPATVHVDGTARIQIVDKIHNLRYYKLIEKFQEAAGVPVLLNTSFNIKGEPMVNTPEEAFSTFIKSGLDVLVLENFIIVK